MRRIVIFDAALFGEFFLVGQVQGIWQCWTCFKNYLVSLGRAVQFTVQLEDIMSNRGKLKVQVFSDGSLATSQSQVVLGDQASGLCLSIPPLFFLLCVL